MSHRRLRAVVRAELATSRRSLAVAALATLGSTAAALLAPWPLKIVFDHVLPAEPLPQGQGFLRPVTEAGDGVALAVLAVAMVVLALARAGFMSLQLDVTTRVGDGVMRAVRQALFAHLQRLSLSFHAKARAGALLTRVTGDATALRDVIGSDAVPAIGDALTLVGMLAVMLALDWQLALVPLVSLPLLYVGLRRSGAGRAGEAISAVAAAAVVVLGALRVRQDALSPGDLLVFTAYLASMYRPVRRLAKASSTLSRAAIGAERIGELLDLEPEVSKRPGAVPAGRLAGALRFDDVRFGYEHDRPVLDGVSFDVPAGSHVALVGASGAGKSTIAALLMRLYDPTSGAVSIDGRDLRDYELESLRRQIALVSQASVLFGASVRENLAYGRAGATHAELEAAARAADAHDFILALADGYDTVLGERGASVSGGQARRLAIARAIVRDASVLILDEPMTGLEPGSEATVQQALDRLMAGRTCVTLTHDLATCAGADRVLVLEHGRLAGHGTHAELLATSLPYRRLATRASQDRLQAAPKALEHAR